MLRATRVGRWSTPGPRQDDLECDRLPLATRSETPPPRPLAPEGQPIAARRRLVTAVMIAFAVAACDRAPPPAPAAPGTVLRTRLGGVDIDLMVADCKLYRVVRQTFAKPHYDLVLEPDFFPLPTNCVRQVLAIEGDYITARLDRMRPESDSCCATSGTYRSRDGTSWERRVEGDQWVQAK